MTTEPTTGADVVPIARAKSRDDDRRGDDGGRCRIQVRGGPDTLRRLPDEIRGGVLPNVFTRDGRLVHIEAVSGTSVGGAIDEDSPLPLSADELSAARLAGLLAEHTFLHKVKHTAKGDAYEEEITPPASELRAVLARKGWEGMPRFAGIVGAPVLRSDGSLLQDEGYDEQTGLFLAPKTRVDRVDEPPTAAQVETSKAWLLDEFLQGFPWVSDADRANYIGLLVTPILRPFLGDALAPFGLVTATTPASGKTLLTAAIGLLYGQRVLPWTDSDDELRKTITSVLTDSAPCVVFDNLVEGSCIDSATLALLITVPTWSDRLLGRNTTAVVRNDRLWLATGNNLVVGADMASRTVLVRLDPRRPDPEARTDFALPNLDQWITAPANKAKILHHLLTLVAAWVADGHKRARGLTMRQFTPWAEAVGGFLEHHSIPGFLQNADAVKSEDEGESTWGPFLARWLQRFPDGADKSARFTSNRLRESRTPDYPGGPDPWEGTFPMTRTGKEPSSIELGRLLSGQKGRFRGRLVLHKEIDSEKRAVFWVERRS